MLTDHSMAVVQHIAGISTPHLKAMNDDLTSEYPDAPDDAFALAIGNSLATLLASLGDPQERTDVVDSINQLVRMTGYTLMSIT
jgi:hypothetical protein